MELNLQNNLLKELIHELIYFLKITNQITNQMNQLLEHYLEEHRSSGKGNALFLGQRGGFGDKGIRKMLDKYTKYDERLADVSPHTLRHCYGKRLADSGVKLTEIQLLMGHSSIEMAVIYLTPDKADLQRASLKADGKSLAE